MFKWRNAWCCLEMLVLLDIALVVLRNLAGMNLSGPIAASIASLTSLTSLYVNLCLVATPFPFQFSHIAYL